MSGNKIDPDKLRRTRNRIGIVAIILLIVFFILEFAGLINFIEWLILVVIVFLVANLALRRLRNREL